MSIDRIRTLSAEAGDDHPFSKLVAIAELRAELDRYEAVAVRQARNLGLSWQIIATALGVSKQAVHKKHGRR